MWGNNGYEGDEFITPVVGQAPEGRGTLLASQDLNFKGSDASNTDDKKPSLTDEQRKERATRGELAVALYLQAGAPEVKLPETSPWPDVKTDDPNYAAYIWFVRRASATAGRTASSMRTLVSRTLPLRRSPTVRLVLLR